MTRHVDVENAFSSHLLNFFPPYDVDDVDEVCHVC